VWCIDLSHRENSRIVRGRSTTRQKSKAPAEGETTEALIVAVPPGVATFDQASGITGRAIRLCLDVNQITLATVLHVKWE
jgi:hypothetical protein